MPTTIATTSTNPVQSRKYDNSNLGISFEYPSNLFIVEWNNGVSVTPIPPDSLRRQSSAAMGDLSISIIKGKTLKDVRKSLIKETLSAKELLFVGHKAIELTSFPDGYSGSTWISILVETKKGVIKITHMEYAPYGESYQSIMESIIIQ